MTKEEIIKAVVCEVKDYRFTHEELMRMSKKELLQYYPQVASDTFQNGNCRWKPTEAQIEALQHAIDACEDEWAYEDTELRSLLNDLKKLGTL